MTLEAVGRALGVAPKRVAGWEAQGLKNNAGVPFPRRIDRIYFRAQIITWLGYPADLIAVWTAAREFVGREAPVPAGPPTELVYVLKQPASMSTSDKGVTK